MKERDGNRGSYMYWRQCELVIRYIPNTASPSLKISVSSSVREVWPSKDSCLERQARAISTKLCLRYGSH